MKRITEDQVKKVADLARLKLNSNQVDNLMIPQFKILSRNSFLKDETLIFTKEEDEIIYIILNKNYKNIEKLLLKFRINKLGFTKYCEE